MDNQEELSLELSLSDMKNKIDIALDDPQRYFKNFLMHRDENNPTNVPILEEYLYCCVWAFVFTCVDGQKELSVEYYELYQEEIDDEIRKLKAIKDSNNKTLKSLTKYPIIRDLVYSKEKEILLEQCNSVEDFEEYIQNYGESCREFFLYAKYRKTLLNADKNNNFVEFAEVIHSFPYSDLFDIELLKGQCIQINGLIVYFPSNISTAKREVITSLIKRLRKVTLLDGTLIYIADCPLNKYEIVILRNYDYSIIRDILSEPKLPQLLAASDVNNISMNLSSLSGLNWSLPNKDLSVIIDDKNISNKIWWKGDICSLNNIDEYRYFLPLITTSGNEYRQESPN